MRHSLLSVPVCILLCTSAAHAQWTENFDTLPVGPLAPQAGWENWSAGADERDDDVKQASRQHAAVVTTRLAVWSEHDRHVESHADEVADELELMISEIATEIVRTLNSGD